MDMIVGKDYDVTQLFEEEWQPPRSPVERDKRRGGRLETEEFYLSVSNSFDICIIRRVWDGRSDMGGASIGAGGGVISPHFFTPWGQGGT